MRDLHDKNSQYMLVAKESGYYKDYDSGKLKSKDLKQLFRNHLLGIKMQQIGEIDQFFSVHFYPIQNVYQAEVAREYKDELKEIYKGSFIDLTFERFIKLLFEAGIEGEWVDYFKKRY